MPRIKLTVFGIVQGVGFRYHTRLKAIEIGLTGYVRNRPEGTVEIVADGDQTQLQQIIQWAHQGSPAAQVDRVEVVDQLSINRFESFVIDY
ncbi:MAG: acylphosphatase [Cyanobacteria bacterium P01_A01_bin.114]